VGCSIGPEAGTELPRQDRPVVRGGRLQAKKKRTDRSYLQGGTPAAEPQITEEPAPEEAVAEVAPAAPTDPIAAFAPPPAPTAPAPPRASAPAPATRATGVVRALQQQGIRKRSDVDLQALGRRDTSYAMHELRRIGVLAVMVVTTLIVLGVVLR